MERFKYSSGSPWEDEVGYSRVIKIGNMVEVAGTTSVNDAGNVMWKNNPFAQTIFILEKIESYLSKAGAELSDVIRTRMFVTNIDDWEEIGKAHGDFFKNIKPVATMVEVSRLIDPDLLVEIEVTAIIDGE